MSGVTVVVGNPKPRSRTYEAGVNVAEQLTGGAPDTVIDLTDLGAGLLDWGSAEVAAAVQTVKDSDLVVVASPTYKATYTGLLKLFLDRFGAGALGGAVAVPLMLGGDLRHSLAPEVFLRPVLVEIGASTPTSGLFLLDSEHLGSDTLDAWLERWRPVVELRRR
jgi:FMN reductase